MSLYEQALAAGVLRGEWIWKIQFIEKLMDKPISNITELDELASSVLRYRFESLIAEHKIIHEAALSRLEANGEQAQSIGSSQQTQPLHQVD
jgi:hypothetical protein